MERGEGGGIIYWHNLADLLEGPPIPSDDILLVASLPN